MITATYPNKSIYFNVSFAVMAIVVLLMSVTSAFAGQQNSWSNQEFKVKGTWSLESRADGNYIVLSDDFKTKNAPDLKLLLSKKDYTEINGKNATDGSAFVAKLTSAKGGQSYKIPANINVKDFNSLIIHCEQYSKLWASTPLN